jgi:hypothetical protein
MRVEMFTSRGTVVAGANVAVTTVFAMTEIVHVEVPTQSPPDQPLNTEPAFGVAVSVTVVPAPKN